MPRTKKKSDSDSSSSSSDDGEQEFDGAEDTPQKGGVGQWSPMQSEEDSDNNGDNTEDSDNDNNEVSLEAIKKKTLGRNVKSIYDLESPAANLNDGNDQHSKMIMDVTSFTDGKTAANHLRQDLTCPICHDRLYNPVSLLCGHSFCQTCLVWWLNELGIKTEDANDSEEEEEEDEANTGTCPTCRHSLPPRQKGMPLFRVNTALKACLDTLYGVEMNQRRMAEIERKHKATKGEGGGLHERGNEEIVKLTEEGEADVRNRSEMNDTANGWVYLHSQADSGYGTSKKISIRRNVVMDDCDQRYQLSMGMTKCVYSRTAVSRVVDVELCLIAMEEDEVESGGFPAIIIEGSDDEALICVGSDRVHTCIQSSAVLIPALETEKAAFGAAQNENDTLKEIPLSRGMIGRDGSVRFRIDVKKILDSARGEDRTEQMELVKLKFSHLDTSVVLELRLPIDDMNGDSADCNIDFGVAESNDKNHSSRFLLDDKDEEEEQMPNDYEDDGFIVDDSDEESNEGAESDNDDCEICHIGGDLLVCDGGDHGGGCGKSYHVECINRESIPEGEWICKACASTLGLKTGIEGHEWEAEEVEEKEEEDQSAPREEDKGNALVDSDDEDNSNVVDLVDSDDEEAVPVRRKKRRKVLEDSDSDDE
mmetsp:Transcript_1755/g.2813  ORF Transcript_1755/g.2813 Transcript_1755/m.2813 type:complete len:649 (+) Transcript_1755:51-1997(+)